ncbi:hypothetical protein MMC26_004961 [Xylographa opegraphella]|nr:hypothetical protein [Xylographa opegraphella]
MSQIKNVAVAGATGNIGLATVHALQTAGFTVTALGRGGSTSSIPAGVRIVTVDYDSIESLTTALKGQDAVVSCIGPFALGCQPNLVEAASFLGVKRFIPAEFGADTLNQQTRAFPILQSKVQVQKMLAEKYEQSGMTYSLLFTGLFFDWGLGNGMILGVKNRTGTLYDGGKTMISTTTIATVAKGITGCLLQPEETKNRGVYIQDAAISQNKLMELTNKVNPGKWDLKDASTVELEKQASAAYERKDPNPMSMSGSVFRMYFGGEAYGQPFKKLDNDLFGIKGMSDKEIETMIRNICTNDSKSQTFFTSPTSS